MQQGYQTLDSIVREVCFELDDYDLRNYPKFLVWAYRAVQEMRMDYLQQIKSFDTVVSHVGTVPFPVDMIKWTKIGEVVGDRIKIYTINNSLTFNKVVECGEAQPNGKYYTSYDSIGEDIDLNNGYLFGGHSSGAIYGYGQGKQGDGQFRLDNNKREFIFGSEYIGKQIIIEYIASGLNPTGETLVEETGRECVIEYIHWMNKERSKMSPMIEKQRGEMRYREAVIKSMKRNMGSVDSLVAIIRKGYKQTPKA